MEGTVEKTPGKRGSIFSGTKEGERGLELPLGWVRVGGEMKKTPEQKGWKVR